MAQELAEMHGKETPGRVSIVFVFKGSVCPQFKEMLTTEI